VSEANNTQIGGDHYKGKKFQPWDWDQYGIGTYEMDILHYVTRQKNGKEDLEKALHYLVKLREEYIIHDRRNRIPYALRSKHQLRGAVEAYATEWNMNYWQTRTVFLLVHWLTIEDLVEVTNLILTWIADAYPDDHVRP
jgi:hypothetical protein